MWVRELSPGPLEEQPVLLTFKAALQSPCHLLTCQSRSRFIDLAVKLDCLAKVAWATLRGTLKARERFQTGTHGLPCWPWSCCIHV